MELRRFFDRAIQASFQDLAVDDPPVASYLADMLTRVARVENVFPQGLVTARLETVVDMLLEAQAVWEDASVPFQPERELSVRRHIGDFTLFMTGVFRERVDRVASVGFYVVQGKRAYRFVSEHDRASGRPQAPAGGPLFRRLADRFEGYASALDYARRVHFPQASTPPFLGLDVA